MALVTGQTQLEEGSFKLCERCGKVMLIYEKCDCYNEISKPLYNKNKGITKSTQLWRCSRPSSNFWEKLEGHCPWRGNIQSISSEDHMNAQWETKPNSHHTGSSATQLIVILYRKENYMNGRPMGYSIFLMSKLNSGEHSNSSQSKLSLLGINSDNGS